MGSRSASLQNAHWILPIQWFIFNINFFIRIGKTDKELFHAIRRGKFRMPDHITNIAQKLIKWMLEHEPDKRPTAQQVSFLLIYFS